MSEEEQKKIKPGPVRHDGLPPDLLVMAKLTYRATGRFVRSTLEEWELGFMRDIAPDQELLTWLGISITFKRYVECHDPMDDETSRRILKCLVIVASHGELTGPHDAPLQAELRQLFGTLNGTKYRDMWEELRRWVGDEGDRLSWSNQADD